MFSLNIVCQYLGSMEIAKIVYGQIHRPCIWGKIFVLITNVVVI